jgi:hypothetical protein
MTTAVQRKSIRKTATRPHKRKLSVGRPRSGKVSITTTIRPDLKRYAAEIGVRTTARGKVVQDVSAGIERALEFYRAQQAETKAAVDANGWPTGFFERTFGSIPDFPERDQPTEFDVREELR